jgi:hypothetical protein
VNLDFTSFWVVLESPIMALYLKRIDTGQSVSDLDGLSHHYIIGYHKLNIQGVLKRTPQRFRKERQIFAKQKLTHQRCARRVRTTNDPNQRDAQLSRGIQMGR